MSGGGRFDFDDGGTYCGGWEDGKAHGFGICTGPKGQGEYAGAWQFGFEASGVYTWPSGNNYEGQWTQGKRHGLGVETKGRWVYRGEWTQGFKGRYGARQSTSSGAKYEGTWTTGLQDGYGVETYADGGTYDGQWLRGMRHGYGVRSSVPYGLASHYRPKTIRDSLTSLRSENEEDHVVKDRDRKINESRGGFVLQAKSEESPTTRRKSVFDKHGRSSLKNTLVRGLKLRKQKSTGDIQESPRRSTGGSVRSTISNISHASAESSQSGVTSASVYTDSNASFVSQDDITDANVTESYYGEWKNDKRSGFGISERSDGLKYEGEWYNNKKYGYGVTTFKDGTKEEGKYKNNTLISSGKKSKLFLLRSTKMRERIDNAVAAAQTASQIAQQKRDIAVSRMANARAKSEQADAAARNSRADSDMARIKAKEYAPEFHQPGTDIIRNKRLQEQGTAPPAMQTEYGNLQKPLLPQNDVQHRTDSLALKRAGTPSSTHAVDGYPLPSDPSAMPPSRNTINEVAPMNDRRRSSLTDSVHKRDTTVPNNIAYANDTRTKPEHVSVAQNRVPPSTMANSATANNNYVDRSRANHQYDYEPQRYDRFSDMLNSTVVTDHFDQYKTLRDDSGLGRELEPPMDEPSRYGQRGAGHKPMSDASPDSGVDTEEIYLVNSRPLQRRKTLPSIVKREIDLPKPKMSAKGKGLTGETIQSQQNLSRAETDTYVIENGIRKRVTAEVYSQPKPAPSTFASSTESLEAPKQLPKRYTLESPSKMRRSAGARGSMPDVSACKELKRTVMPRAEACMLGEQRRREMRAQTEEEERRKQQEIVLRLGDVKDWCQQRQLMMLVIAVNVSLATMFFNLLSQ